VPVCIFGFLMCGFCVLRVLKSVILFMSWFCNVMDMFICGFCIVCICVVGFPICGYVYIMRYEMCACLYVLVFYCVVAWVFSVCLFVVFFQMGACVYVGIWNVSLCVCSGFWKFGCDNLFCFVMCISVCFLMWGILYVWIL